MCDSPMRKDGLLVWDGGSTSLVRALVCVSPKLSKGEPAVFTSQKFINHLISIGLSCAYRENLDCLFWLFLSLLCR